MTKMMTCGSCNGFVPAALSECPHCGQGRPRPPAGSAVIKAVKGIAAAAFGMTLMACYGGPISLQEAYAPCDDQGPGCSNGLTCTDALEQRGVAICTTRCSASQPCPTAPDGRAGVCVRNECYLPCASDRDCAPFQMNCRTASDGSQQICVPDRPGARTPYASCSGFGTNSCGMGTECVQPPAAAVAGDGSGATFTAGRHCSSACSADRDCPFQGVCVSSQCFLPCTPASATDRCASVSNGGHACRAVAASDGATRDVCVPAASAVR